MSWSVSGVGKASALREKLRGDFSRIKCAQPEETIKNYASAAVDDALAAFPDDTAVHVEASGSQYSPSNDGKFINSLSVKVAPLHGFVG